MSHVMFLVHFPLCQLPQWLFPPAHCTLKALASLCTPHSPTTHHLHYDIGYTLKTYSLQNQPLTLNGISVILTSIRTTYPTPHPLPSFTHISASTLLTAHSHIMKALVTYEMQ